MTENLDNPSGGMSARNGKSSILSSVISFFSVFGHGWRKLVPSLILSLAACILFGVFFTAGTADVLTAQLKLCYENDIQVVLLGSSAHYYNVSSLPLYYNESGNDGLSEVQLQKLEEAVGGDKLMLSYNIDLLTAGFRASDPSEYDLVTALGIPGKTWEVDPETGETDACLTAVAADSRLPQTFSEIALTDVTAELLVRSGYTETDGTLREFSAADDLVGTSLNGYTVVGVYATQENLSFLQKMEDVYGDDEDLLQYDEESGALVGGAYVTGGHLADSVLVCSGFAERYFDENEYLTPVMRWVQCFYRLQGELSADRAFLQSLSHEEEVNGNTYYRSARLSSVYSGVTESATAYFGPTSWGVVIGYPRWQAYALLSVILAFLSVVLTAGFLSEGARRQGGGMRFRPTAGGLFFVGKLALTLAAVAAACAALNAANAVAVFALGWVQVCWIAFFVLVEECLAVVFSLLPLGRKRDREGK